METKINRKYSTKMILLTKAQIGILQRVSQTQKQKKGKGPCINYLYDRRSIFPELFLLFCAVGPRQKNSPQLSRYVDLSPNYPRFVTAQIYFQQYCGSGMLILDPGTGSWIRFFSIPYFKYRIEQKRGNKNMNQFSYHFF